MTSAAYTSPSQDAGSALPIDALLYQNLLNAIVSAVMNRSVIPLTVTGSASLAATASPALPQYVTGNAFWWVAESDCLGATQINVDANGLKPLTDRSGVPLVSGAYAAGDLIVAIYDGTNVRILITVDPDAAGSGRLPPGYIADFGLANNATDSVNDIDVSRGKARAESDTRDIVLDTALTKRFDAIWSQGTNNGGMLQSAIQAGTVSVAAASATVNGTGTSFTAVFIVGDVIQTAGNQARRITAIASDLSLTVESAFTTTESGVTYKRGGKAPNSAFRIYAIANDATGAADVAASARDLPIDLPAGWSAFARIWYLLTDSAGANLQFLQTGDVCRLKAPFQVFGAAGDTTVYPIAFLTQAPPGTVAKLRLRISAVDPGTSTVVTAGASLYPVGASAPTGVQQAAVTFNNISATDSFGDLVAVAEVDVPVDATGAVNVTYTHTNASAHATIRVDLLGWRDVRGAGAGGVSDVSELTGEVVLARGGFASLGDRLDAIDGAIATLEAGLPGLVDPPTIREFVAAGDCIVGSSDTEVHFNKTVGALFSAVLPATHTVGVVVLKDKKGDAATNAIIVKGAKPAMVTISIATPGVITETAHGRSANSPVVLNTTGALPTGLAPDTIYYVKTVLSVDTYTVSATPGGAAINTTGSQSGTHTLGSDLLDGAATLTIDWNYGGLRLRKIIGGWLTLP